MIEKVTDALISVEGESLQEKTVVMVEKIKSGDWGVGGEPLTTEAVKNLQASR